MGIETEFINALKENTLLDYTPEAPVLLIHGKDDVTVPLFNSRNLMEQYTADGKQNLLSEEIEGDHEGAAREAIISAMLWFESLRNESK